MRLGCLRLPNVPRLRRFPVLAFFFREYRRYFPDFSFRIMLLPILCFGGRIQVEVSFDSAGQAPAPRMIPGNPESTTMTKWLESFLTPAVFSMP